MANWFPKKNKLLDSSSADNNADVPGRYSPLCEEPPNPDILVDNPPLPESPSRNDEVVLVREAAAGFSNTAFSHEDENIPMEIANSEQQIQISQELQKLMEEGKYDEVKSEYEKMFESWKNIEVNIAVTGESGSGKSSFINTMRKLTADDDGAAAVGVTETTLERQVYADPKNEKLRYWDLPGIGGTLYSEKMYIEKILKENYDFFIIISSERFSAYDLALAKEIQNKKRKFYFVRSKLDADMRGELKAHPETFKEEVVKATISADLQNRLEENELDYSKVFLVEMYDFKRFDFPKLLATVTSELEGFVKDVFLYGVVACSIEVLRLKKTRLKSRIDGKAWLSAALAAIASVPVVTAPACNVVEILLLKQEVYFYRKVFSLDKRSLMCLSEEVRRNVEDKKIKKEHLADMITENLSKGNIAARCVPILGVGIAARSAYQLTRVILNDCLEKTATLAEEVWLSVAKEAQNPAST